MEREEERKRKRRNRKNREETTKIGRDKLKSGKRKGINKVCICEKTERDERSDQAKKRGVSREEKGGTREEQKEEQKG